MRYGFAKAYAKLNLTLDVLSLRDDGFHDLRMVMQSVSLCDSVSVRISEGEGVSVVSNVRHIPNDDRNIAIKAANAFSKACGKSFGKIDIAIEKRIPSSAGMAGGSADGAAVLRLLSGLTGENLSDLELCEIGLTVGSDIPFCLMGGTYLAEGRGEILTPITPLCDTIFVIGKPKRGMSTKAVFTELDSHVIEKHPDTAGMISAIEFGDVGKVSKLVYNVFEPVVSQEVSEIGDIKTVMSESGALCAAMTGSGSAVFGIFDDGRKANMAAAAVKALGMDAFVTRPVSSEDVKKCILCSK